MTAPLVSPPSPGTSGQFIDSIVITSSTNRQIVVIGDPASTASLAPVTTSGGLLVGQSNTVRSLSSGIVTLSSPTSLSSGIVSPSSNWTVATLSSGAIVLSSAGLTGVLFPINTSAGFGPVTSSAGQLVSLSSGTVTLSSNPTVVLSSPTSLSSGTVTLSSNPTVVLSSPTSLSSGVVNISSAGISPTLLSVTSTAGFAPVTSSAGLTANITSGSITVNVPTSVTVTYSSNPTVVLTSGAILSSSVAALVTLTSGALLSTANSLPVVTSGTLVVVSASSGVVQVLQSTGTAGGVTSTYIVAFTTVTGIKASAGRLIGLTVYSTTVSGNPVIAFYDLTTGNVTVGSSVKLAIPIPLYSTGTASTGSLLPLMPAVNTAWFGPNGITFANGISAAPQVSATGVTISTATFVQPVALSVFYV